MGFTKLRRSRTYIAHSLTAASEPFHLCKKAITRSCHVSMGKSVVTPLLRSIQRFRVTLRCLAAPIVKRRIDEPAGCKERLRLQGQLGVNLYWLVATRRAKYLEASGIHRAAPHPHKTSSCPCDIPIEVAQPSPRPKHVGDACVRCCGHPVALNRSKDGSAWRDSPFLGPQRHRGSR
jgi:hypothetical protein